MKVLGKSILMVALAWFVASLCAIFWPSTTATIFDNSKVSFSQNGYGGVGKSGVSSFNGRTSSFNKVTYSYSVKDKIYVGTGIIGFNNTPTIDVYYCPLYPDFSLTNNNIPLLLLILLCIVGIGLLEIDKWLHGSLQQKLP